MSESKPWVDGPFKLIPSSKAGAEVGKESKGAKQLASEMCIVHNVLIRGLNAVYNQARNVTTRGTAKDKSDFTNFAHGWSVMLEEHHHTEETAIFPEINELTGVPGLMDGNVDEHKAFHDGLLAYTGYLDKVRNGTEELDGDKLNSIIDSFAVVLRDHLENEIDTLLGLEKYEDKCDWGVWFKAAIDKITIPAMKNSEYRTNEGKDVDVQAGAAELIDDRVVRFRLGKDREARCKPRLHRSRPYPGQCLVGCCAAVSSGPSPVTCLPGGLPIPALRHLNPQRPKISQPVFCIRPPSSSNIFPFQQLTLAIQLDPGIRGLCFWSSSTPYSRLDFHDHDRGLRSQRVPPPHPTILTRASQAPPHSTPGSGHNHLITLPPATPTARLSILAWLQQPLDGERHP
ncbi:hypothetical protein AK830_g11694 [Neonectria ditissima]|uniref:Hemerythrin-like domain-containing protein n=1 Tax=Neonectria ditissima TaxID=78410 RepID=A0A0P7B4M5_9HYPO|nr:hypothetical protein AK830_g11694 [Neonectria ditissima]